MMPFFSIIIPVYNVAPYLRECLDSVLAQTFADWEAICIDDGSTDGSGAILDEYAAKDCRFRVIHQSNAGVSAARNKALAVIAGNWFLFLDGDDVILPKSLSVFHAYAQNNVLDGILTSPYYVLWDGGSIKIHKSEPKILVGCAKKEDLYLGKFAANGFPFSRLYRTEVFKGLRFRCDLSMAEDVCYWFDALAIDAQWMIINFEYYLYRQRSDSACGKCSPDKSLQVLESVRYAVNSIPNGRTRYDYVRRFPWSPTKAIRLAAQRYWELSDKEWCELATKCLDIRSLCQKWPFGICEEIIVFIAPYRYVRTLMPIVVFVSRSLQWLWARIGKIFNV